MSINIEVKQVRNVQSAKLTFPFEKGLYAIVGENGCGKSTIMLILSLMVKTSSAHMLKQVDINESSTIDIEVDGLADHWFFKNGKMTTGKFCWINGHGRFKSHSALVVNAHVQGFYEGSIFYGCRFDDFSMVDEVMKAETFLNDLVDAEEFVVESMGYILHNRKNSYRGLKRIKNRAVAEAYGFKGIPYFFEVNGGIISQFQMSSGECMLLSLIDFINNIVIKNSARCNKLLFLIDEVELALHPGAIDRLVLFFNQLLQNGNVEIVVYFSTHSAELLQRIHPKNIFLVENTDGEVEMQTPCYPNYAVRSLYIPNGYDFVILVEDELSKALVDKIIRDNHFAKSKLCCVLPAGGWSQMTKLHSDIVTYNTLGFGKRLISIYDGDVESLVSEKEEYKRFPKAFLPIPSIEKYIYKKCIIERNRSFIKMIGDKYFSQRSLPDIIADYIGDPRTSSLRKQDGKAFYDVFSSNLLSQGIDEQSFIKYLCDDIAQYEDFTRFTASIKRLLE